MGPIVVNWGEPIRAETRPDWRTWLARNHHSKGEAFLRVFKESSSLPGIRYDDAVEEALCFGWIDGICRRFDDDRMLHRFSPRRRRSPWSESNVGRVRRLYRLKRIEQAGLDAMPADLREELTRTSV